MIHNAWKHFDLVCNRLLFILSHILCFDSHSQQLSCCVFRKPDIQFQRWCKSRTRSCTILWILETVIRLDTCTNTWGKIITFNKRMLQYTVLLYQQNVVPANTTTATLSFYTSTSTLFRVSLWVEDWSEGHWEIGKSANNYENTSFLNLTMRESEFCWRPYLTFSGCQPLSLKRFLCVIAFPDKVAECICRLQQHSPVSPAFSAVLL